MTPIHRRWETDMRYYEAVLQQDLFCDWEVVLAWGGKGTHFGRIYVCHVDTYESGLHRIEQVTRRRRQRGYAVIANS